MTKVLKELVKIVELPGKQVVTVLGEDIKKIPSFDQKKVLRALYVLARQKFYSDYQGTNPILKIGEIQEQSKNNVSSVSILCDQNNNYVFSLQFGVKSNPNATVLKGLAHWCEIFTILENEQK